MKWFPTFLLCVSLQAQAQCEFTEVSIETSTDEWGEEMSWILYQSLEGGESFPLASFQGQFDGTTTSQTLCLEDGCYFFSVLDSWGDGWNGGEISCSPTLEGFMEPFTLDDGYEGYLAFQVGDGVCDTSLPGCTDPNALNPVQGANVDDGSCVYLESFVYEDNSETVEREYIYYHPATAPENCPLVFVFHGYTGSAVDIMEYSEFNAIADNFGFAVCYPQGSLDSFGNAFFNVGYDFQVNEDVDDLAFTLALNAQLQANHSLDEGAVYATGMSNGGDFCYLLACQASDVFQAVAPVSGMIMQDIMDACNPSSTTNILEIHGTNDDVTYYDGDPTNQDGWGAYPSIPETMGFFVDLYQLMFDETVELPNLDPTDGSQVEASAWSNEAQCPRVELFKVVGGGHDWPGAWGNMDISASLVAWDFFDRTCNTGLPLSVETMVPQSEAAVQGTWDILGRPCPSTAPGQLLIQRLSNGKVQKVVRLTE